MKKKHCQFKKSVYLEKGIEYKQNHPYENLPDIAYWKKSISDITKVDEVDLFVQKSFKITKNDRVAPIGSCFAQHISGFLKSNKFNYFLTEYPHPLLPRELYSKYSYEIFPARFGNIYTPRQLLQLFDRAFNKFKPKENIWLNKNGNLIDPFRPKVEPYGFINTKEFFLSRNKHLDAVKRMFENLDILIFTLGLTETWMNKHDGAVYPLCPGVIAGSYDPKKYKFYNFELIEIVKDLKAFLKRLFRLNRNCKVILTVSPVPLIATATQNHVLAATVYSKSVLRVAADIISRNYENAYYFPSYEIITGNFNRGNYFDDDLRTVKKEGVDHVMRTFAKYFIDIELEKRDIGFGQFPSAKECLVKTDSDNLGDLEKVLCDMDELEKE